MSARQLLLSGLGGLFLGILLTIATQSYIGSSREMEVEREVHLGVSDFVNPLLDCPASSAATPPSQAALENEISDYVSRKTKTLDVREIAVYFRDLNNGPAFGISPRSKFSTASLLKVPVMIGVFKRTETRPGLLDERVVYDRSLHDIPNLTQTVDPPEPLVPGKSYSVRELIERMIILSDNAASAMLISYLPDIDVVKVLQEMGVKMEVREDDVSITVRSYASVFRILYNATYLNKAMSNKALSLLARSRLRVGLPAGAPEDVPVAHKFGERTIGTVSQFHDCGIVYHPQRPYLLCVMTRGRSYPPLVKTVAEVSRMVFEKVNHGPW